MTIVYTITFPYLSVQDDLLDQFEYLETVLSMFVRLYDDRQPMHAEALYSLHYLLHSHLCTDQEIALLLCLFDSLLMHGLKQSSPVCPKYVILHMT